MCVFLGLKKPGDFTVSEGHGYSLVYLIWQIWFASIQTQTNYMICTKVRDKI